tara:strand:+ start:16524 stop:18071 length:1548 start_codon:yes stop_codon:yes gene_type:complete
MAGILNSKQRVMDTLITTPGRFQAASGHMQFRYVTFTDRHAFYDSALAPTASDVAGDAGDRIYFEAMQRFQDTLCIETDHNGLITALKAPPILYSGSIFELLPNLLNKFSLTGAFPTGVNINPLNGGMPNEFIKGLEGNYQSQRFLASIDPFAINNKFIISTGSINFDTLPEPKAVTDESSASPDVPQTLERSTLPRVWEDHRFTHVPNFLYLPPINKLPPGAQMARILPFIVTGLKLPEMDFKQAMKKMSEFMGLPAAVVKLLDSDDLGLLDGLGLVVMLGILEHFLPNGAFKIDGLPNGVLENVSLFKDGFHAPDEVKQYTGGGITPYKEGDIATELDKIGAVALGVQGLNEKDFAAARLCYQWQWPAEAATKYQQRETKLSQVIDRLKAKAGDNPKSNKQIIGNLVTFPETSKNNNLIMQIFEFPRDKAEINKLAVIDAGELSDGNPNGNQQRLFYVGKMYQDKDNTGAVSLRFANIFTMILNSSVGNAATGAEIFDEYLINPNNKFLLGSE